MSTVIANPVEMTAHGASRVTHNDAELRARVFDLAGLRSTLRCRWSEYCLPHVCRMSASRSKLSFVAQYPGPYFLLSTLQPVPLGPPHDPGPVQFATPSLC